MRPRLPELLAAASLLGAAACRSPAGGSTAKDFPADAAASRNADGSGGGGGGNGVAKLYMTGVEKLDAPQGDLNSVPWFNGTSDCTKAPLLQVYQYGPNTYILRESKCVTFEGPFNFLLFGRDKALLLDTGDQPNQHTLPLAAAQMHPDSATVNAIIQEWQAANGVAQVELVVAHTHSHGDHVGGDSQFFHQPHTVVVAHGAQAVKQFFFSQASWPEDVVKFDLGGRELQITGIPGHLNDHIAVFDPETKWLFSGDSLYPGRLYIGDWAAYHDSMIRLNRQAQLWQPALVVGNHIEMSTTPGQDFQFQTTYQPNEHKLPLGMAQLGQLAAKLKELGPDRPTNWRTADFIICPDPDQCDSQNPNNLNPL